MPGTFSSEQEHQDALGFAEDLKTLIDGFEEIKGKMKTEGGKSMMDDMMGQAVPGFRQIRAEIQIAAEDYRRAHPLEEKPGNSSSAVVAENQGP